MGHSEDYSLASDLFMELASETRFSILGSLYKRPAKLSSLSRELDVTVQDVYRNLNRLVQEGLVRRADGMFYVTEYGMVVTKQMPDLIFMRKHRKFFEDHILDGAVPDKFVQRVGALENCKTISSVTAVFQNLKRLQSSASNTLKIIVSQAWPEEGEILIDRAGQGVRVFAIVGHNTIFPRNVVEIIIPRISELVSKGVFDRRMVEKVSIAVFIADNREAALMFPNTKGEVDMNTMFIGEDPMFCEWCADYFDYMWNSSLPFSMKKVKVVD